MQEELSSLIITKLGLSSIRLLEEKQYAVAGYERLFVDNAQDDDFSLRVITHCSI